MDVLAARIKEIIEPSLSAMGFALVRVQLSGGRRPQLQVMAERADGTMTVDDCAEVSRMVSALLDVEDPIDGEYTLEVSSPGIDRPLTRPADFDRFSGLEAKVELRLPRDGRRRFRGRLAGSAGETVRLEVDDSEVSFDFTDIQRAKLVMNDELLALAAAATAAPEKTEP